MFTNTTQINTNNEIQLVDHQNHTVIDIPNQQVPQPQSSWLGRAIRRLHPVQFLSGAGTACGLTTAGVGGAVAYLAYSTSNYVIFGLGLASGVVGATLAATSCISTVYLCAWRPLKKLEQITQDIQQATGDIHSQEKQLNKRKSELIRINDLLRQQLQAERQLHEQASKKVEDKTQEIQALTKRLELISQSLAKAKDIAKEWDNSAKLITQQVDYFKTNSLDHEIHEISAQVTNASIIQDDLEQDAESLREFAQSMHDLSSTWNDMVNKLNMTLKELSSDVTIKEQHLEQTRKELQRLDRTNEDLTYNNILLEDKLNLLEKETRELKNSESTLQNTLEQLKSSISLLEIPEVQEAISNYLNKQETQQ